MIYLDYAATTRVRPEAVQAAVEAMTEGYGNPSAQYAFGAACAQRLKEHRAVVADALGCLPEEIFFTSCGTEGDNWAIRGGVELNRHNGRHIITTAIEHAAVLEPMKKLAQEGYEVTYLKPDPQGNIGLEQLEKALRPDTILVSMMLVNNELGTVLPVAQATELTRQRAPKALFHCDGVQGFLKLPFTPQSLGVDLLAVSGHKIGAPKGIGALYVKKALHTKWKPLIVGGGQEFGLRSGTEPTAQIAAFAKAVQLGKAQLEEHAQEMQALKAYALKVLQQAVPDLKQVGRGTAPHILAVTIPGARSEVLVRELGDRGICVSKGSACHRGGASHVYADLPSSKAEREGVFRVSFSPETTPAELDQLAQAVQEIREQRFPLRRPGGRR